MKIFQCECCLRICHKAKQGAFTARDITRDHIVPKAIGGSNAASNIMLLCRACNEAKADQEPEAWLASLGEPGLKLRAKLRETRRWIYAAATITFVGVPKPRSKRVLRQLAYETRRAEERRAEKRRAVR